jgi:uncharacterized protein (DUF1697 family)
MLRAFAAARQCGLRSGEAMGVFIALYRGINVGGNNSVKMEALRAMHDRLGHKDVKSYIQSGNIVLRASGTPESIARNAAAEFVKEFGFAAKIVVVDAKRWGTMVQANPFAKMAAENHKAVHVGICQGAPSASGLQALFAKTGGTEKFEIGKGVVYLHLPNGVGTSKFAAGVEKACGVAITVRNWRTVEAIWEMVK